MAGSRKVAREFTLQGVYAWLVGGADITLIAANLKDDEQFKRADEAYFRTLLYGVIKEEDLSEHAPDALPRPPVGRTLAHRARHPAHRRL